MNKRVIFIRETKKGKKFFDYKGHRAIISKVKYQDGDSPVYTGTIFSKNNKPWKAIPCDNINTLAKQITDLIDGEI